MPNRHERRHPRQPVVVVGEGIVARSTGQFDEAIPMAKLPPKIPGCHRWIANAGYVVPESMVAKAHDAAEQKFLDHESLFTLSIGCWDCEQPLGAIEPGSVCPAEASD